MIVDDIVLTDDELLIQLPETPLIDGETTVIATANYFTDGNSRGTTECACDKC